MNYKDTFIMVAPDCPVSESEIPPVRGNKKPMHLIQYELISEAPYAHSQEDVLWQTHIRHKGLAGDEASPEAREAFLSKPSACLRASALAKRYGWGFHFNQEGKVALYGVESEEYGRFVEQRKSTNLKLLAAMRSRRG